MTAYGVGAVSLAAALGLATAMPMWVAVTFIGLAVLIITLILRSVGSPGRAPARVVARALVRPRVVVPIPRQRGARRLPRAVE